MNLLRLLKVLLRGLRPISHSLASISTSLHTLARINEFRLAQEGFTLPDEKLMRNPGREDLTELSWDVKEARIDPQTGRPEVEAEFSGIDFASIFRPQ